MSLGYYCSRCNRALEPMKRYHVKIKNVEKGQMWFESDICPHCYVVISNLLKGGSVKTYEYELKNNN